MGLTYFHDVGARTRSPMLKQLPLCNGEQTGCECIHYWRQVVRKDVMNPGDLRKGETFRYCKLAINAPDHSMAMFLEGDLEMAVECTEYRADRKRRFNASADDYRPLSPEELLALQEGRAVPRFSPKRWWQVWRRRPKVEVVYLTLEELEEVSQKALKLKLSTQDAPDGGILGKGVLDGDVLAPPGERSSAPIPDGPLVPSVPDTDTPDTPDTPEEPT